MYRHFIKGLGYEYDVDGFLVYSEGNRFEYDEDGELIGEYEPVYCNNKYCEARAQHVVPVSVKKAHDGHRRYCEACVDVYYVGVQHGRYHEAACHGMCEPIDNSPQERPNGEAEGSWDVSDLRCATCGSPVEVDYDPDLPESWNLRCTHRVDADSECQLDQNGYDTTVEDEIEDIMRQAVKDGACTVLVKREMDRGESEFIELNDDEFAACFPLLPNPLNPHACWQNADGVGCLFGTDGEEEEFVRSQDPATIWTLVGDGEGGDCIISGYHFVNRLGYFLSTVPVPEGTVIEVRDEDDEVSLRIFRDADDIR